MPDSHNTCYDKSDKKREASSPLNDSGSLIEKKTRHYSGEDAQSQGSLSRSHSVSKDVEADDITNSEVPVHVLPQPINPNDIVQIATSLRALMLPELKLVVREAMEEATKSLQDEVKKLNKDVKDLEEENEDLRKANSELETRLAVVEYETDNLEQYSRRNSLRISGIEEDKDENTDQEVIRIAGQLGVDIGPYDIDRSHRVGKLKVNRARHGRGSLRAKRKPRDILVKFSTYNARNTVDYINNVKI